MNPSIADIRKDYKLQSLLENEVKENPFDQFKIWWDEAIKSNIDEVNAFTLATVSKQGKPSARIVLLKNVDKEGFSFFTNYESNKANQIAQNNNAAICFFWKELERQVRIEGKIVKVSKQESDAYFNSRPTGSKIGAWASPQSRVINSRNVLEENEATFTTKFGENIPRPEHWGGYKLIPEYIEFWQGRSNRLHDRLAFTLFMEGEWIIERLAP